MNDGTIDSMLNSISALALNKHEVSNGATSVVNYAGKPYGYTTSIDNEISPNQSYFDSLREKLYIDKTSKMVKGNLGIKTLVADILNYCSDEEIDELIACITSDSEYLSRKGYNSINLKGD